MYVCMYVCMYVYIYIYIFMCVHMYICISMIRYVYTCISYYNLPLPPYSILVVDRKTAAPFSGLWAVVCDLMAEILEIFGCG